MRHIKLFEEFTANQVTCDNCNWSWKLQEGGKDVFVCHKCGYDNEPMLGEKFILQNLENEYEVTLDLWDNGTYLELSKIEIPKSKRGEGLGTAVMQKIVDYADKVGKKIYLTPSKDFGASSILRLEKFYKQFDFVKKPKDDFSVKHTMVRYSK